MVCNQELVSSITRITHTHKNGVNGALLQCAAIQTALLTDDKPSPDQYEAWTDSFLNKLLERMKKHEGQLDAYVMFCLVVISLFGCIVATAAAYCLELLYLLLCLKF